VGIIDTQTASPAPPAARVRAERVPVAGPRATPRPSPARTVGAVAAVAAAGLVLPLAVARAYGALGIVRNDDWSYLLTLFNWVDHGRLDFNNWVSMTLLTQLVLAAPIAAFGHKIAWIQLETALLGFAGLCMVMWFAFSVTRRLWKATFVALLVAAGPLWGPLAVSFMTDVPAFAVSMLAVALGVRAIAGRVSLPYLFASMFAGLVAFSIRQYGAVPLAAVVVVAGWMLWHEERPRRLWPFLVATATMVVAAGVFWAFWRTIPHPKAFSPSMPSGHSVRATLYKGTGAVRLVGLLVVPAIILAGPVRIVQRAWRVAADTTMFVAAGTLAVLGFTGSEGPNIAFAGNYVVPNGVLADGVAKGARPDILPGGVFPALIVLGSIATALLAVTVVPLLHEIPARVRDRDWAPRDPVAAFLGLVVAGYAAAHFLAGVTGIPIYDRYALPVVPVVAVLLLRPRAAEARGAATGPPPDRTARLRPWAGGLALAALAGLGFVYAADSAAFDGTRWKVATAATDAGWSRRQIRGGFEWTNYHAGTPVGRRGRYCVTVVVNPPGGADGPDVVAHDGYRSPLTGRVEIVARRTRLPCTPARTPR
jgi:hypothetical protein